MTIILSGAVNKRQYVSNGILINMNIKEAIREFDKSDYLRFLEEFPDQITKAHSLELPNLSTMDGSYRSVVIAGMGGSAIGGELIQSLYARELTTPLHVVRDYSLPAFVNEETLVCISSYSGNTEETLASYSQARERKASLICITTGGQLAETAQHYGDPVISIPAGYQPRAALGYSVMPLIKILNHFQLLSNKDRDIDETIECLTKLKSAYHPDNYKSAPPFELSGKLSGTIPLIYTGYAPFYVLGTRWKCQFNENAKILSYSQNLPELNHNEIMGWNTEVTGQSIFHVIFLRDNDEDPQIIKRIETTKEIIETQNGSFSEVRPTGSSVLTRLFSLLYFGDYTSYYLALLLKRDPSRIDNINYLKSKL
jgi:glucose/mannose-6-phosphate isomerase